jgi:hypothetical protein
MHRESWDHANLAASNVLAEVELAADFLAGRTSSWLKRGIEWDEAFLRLLEEKTISVCPGIADWRALESSKYSAIAHYVDELERWGDELRTLMERRRPKVGA